MSLRKVIETIERVAGGICAPNLADLLTDKESRYQVLATKVTRKQAELIKKEELKGIGFQEGNSVFTQKVNWLLRRSDLSILRVKGSMVLKEN